MLELSAMASSLATADGQQEMLKKEQLLVTSARIELFYPIWDTLSKNNSAAKIIFVNDPARLAIYQLYDGGSSDSKASSSPNA